MSQTERLDITQWSEPDWRREAPRRFWDPSRKLLATIRDYQRLSKPGIWFGSLRRNLCVARHRFWSIVTGCEIDLRCQIEGGLMIPHPNGIVIHPDSRIGANCLIFQQVTLAGPVTLGYHVDIGAGAKLIGPLAVGNESRIGANAVVTTDVPAGITVAGVPAREITPLKTKSAVADRNHALAMGDMQ